MIKFSKKITTLSLIAGFSTIALIGCGGSEDATPNTDATESGAFGTSVFAVGDLNGVFSPFFYTTAYDDVINGRVHMGLLGQDRLGQVVPEAATFNIEETTTDSGDLQTVYTFTLQDGIKFSDGEPMTADDVMFNFLVLLDPTYDGMSTLNTLPIVGLADYKEGDATEIAGIKKLDDKTVQVTIDGIDPAAIYKFAISVTPEHYYGTTFKKGDLSGVKLKNEAPLGAGPFIFDSFANNVVNLVNNPNYFFGAPKLDKLKFQVIDQANMFEAVRSQQVDLSDPSASPEMVANVEEAGLHYELVDNLGYGYIGINAERVPDINVRKGLMHLMNRAPAVESYYGDLATVIERPMSTVSWAYPQDATEYYGYDVAKAKEYFVAAGYTEVDGKLVKDGKQLRIEVGIPGGGTMDHPTAPVLTQMKSDLEAMGAVLEIADTDGSLFFDVLNQKGWDMWVAAWGSTADPDMYQIYHSTGPSNHYSIFNDDLDKIIVDARSTNDVAVRTNLYQQALDIIMDQAVEMPVYQRKNMYVFNPEMINIDSLTDDMTPYYNFYSELQNIEMVK
ncbi:ABC transporter substrate-binding protein [Candidatus Epulonipiscium viviparus]|uniref:ABC transporter substrate-binding protein n=1 Tax=Candidatus Epulonipiscium viviparus TaxID=420336 RepID=UPI00273813DF|nr:ABC transporter substrate-binding protein [Candidatus Epulopiscium viviparus]